MSTLADMKARIANEVSRSDLDDMIALAISDAIDTYYDKRFFFNESREIVFDTVPGQEFYDKSDEPNIPDLLAIDYVKITVDNAIMTLRREPLAERLDPLDRAMQMRPRLGMDGDDVRAGIGEVFQKGVDRRDHQMDVEGLGAVRTQRLHHARPDGDVGDEVPVHHVDMNPVGAGGVDRAHLLAESGKVS